MLMLIVTTLIILLAVSSWAWAYRLNLRRTRASDRSGNAEQGVIVFVEPLRWLGIVWGFARFCRGLRRAGVKQHVQLFRWGTLAGAVFVLPDYVRRRWLSSQADRLAERLEALAVQYPGQPIHLVGYSTGCFLALEAVRRLDGRAAIGQVILLAAAVSPRYPFAEVAARAQGVHCFCSRVDFVISGLAPLLFGANDGRWGAACGMVGIGPGSDRVCAHAWTPSLAPLGYYGDHFTITAPRFVAGHVAPLLERQALDGE